MYVVDKLGIDNYGIKGINILLFKINDLNWRFYCDIVMVFVFNYIMIIWVV